jgi:hypothetical protein
MTDTPGACQFDNLYTDGPYYRKNLSIRLNQKGGPSDTTKNDITAPSK